MKWTDKEVKYLKENYCVYDSIENLSKKLKKSKKAIYHQAARNMLSREKIPINKPKDPNHRNKYDQEYYANNKKEIYKNKKNRIKNYKLELIKKLGGKCRNCGYNKSIAALEFHHLNDKESNIGSLFHRASRQKILKEVSKCRLLCANCHRELHHKGT